MQDLAAVLEPVRLEMDKVERELSCMLSRVESDGRSGGILGRIIGHPFAAAGKRIRPGLVILSARAAGDSADEPALVALAAAVEVLHAASLVHDDVIDEAESRREQVSLNRRFGNSEAVLAGDVLYTSFFSRILALSSVSLEKRAAVLELFLATTKSMCFGEILAQEAGARPLSLEEYLDIATGKTAAFFSACCRSGAFLGGAEETAIERLAEFGLRFGLLFQIADDRTDRDVRLEAAIDLEGLARANAGAARACLEPLPDGTCRSALFALLDSVAARALAAR